MTDEIAPGCYVDGWWGHYSAARALQIARELGWEPDDARTVDAIALTKLSTGHVGVSIDDANDARRAAGLAVIDESDVGFDVDEWVHTALDDAEAWLDEHHAPTGHFWGHHPAGGVGWGLWHDDVYQ